MVKIIVTGCGTGVGKTIASAILTTLLQADYWKPIECGDEHDSDTNIMKKLVDPLIHTIHPPVYSLKAHLSPHHAARLENVTINPHRIIPPKTTRPLIIETAGGLLVPLTVDSLSLDLLQSWNALWVVVSHHYLGSINHTLLTLEILKQRKASILCLIFNGEPVIDSEDAILQVSQIPLLGKLIPEKTIDKTLIQKYASTWKTQLHHILRS